MLRLPQWDDETDMAKLEECVRSVQMDGLLWGSGKLVAVGYGIKKLQINCVVEDDKVGTDILEEELTKFEDYVSHDHLMYLAKEKKALIIKTSVFSASTTRCVALTALYFQ